MRAKRNPKNGPTNELARRVFIIPHSANYGREMASHVSAADFCPGEMILTSSKTTNLAGRFWPFRQPSGGVILLLQILSAVPRFFICTGMARCKKMSEWLFMLWPVLFMSGIFGPVIHEQGPFRTGAIVIGTTLAIVFSLAMIAFYLQHSPKVLFEEQNSNTDKPARKSKSQH